ncbi:uncharacterized protein LOC134656894 [Cydia amplana]|uniref:uncharacterized protein LOC134656894 n=1 Tax=Cydia amplana TaxID=1869771 RepID=UPI002FE5CD8B
MFDKEMECTEFDDCDSECGVISRRKKFSWESVYAGLVICLVPSVVCSSDWYRLSYESIYNNTDYVQLHHQPRPFTLPNYNLTNTAPRSFSSSDRDSYLDTKDNELEYEEFASSHKHQLLVGFARDPFRTSVPEQDYLKGVRHVEPQPFINKGENRGKRGVVHLANMMYCATGCDPLSYKGYGCYCGFLGEGRPTDGIDNCCRMHDRCYENIYCPFFTVYFQPYYWKCYHGEPLCALENYKTQHQFINGCAARSCECDRQFAMCIRRYPCPRRRALCKSSPLRLLQNLLMFR